MRALTLRLEDDLHTALTNTAHDYRTSINSYVVGLIEENVNTPQVQR